MKYAILESGGKQFRAVEGGVIEVDRLPVEPGAKVKLEQVLLLADGENVTVGTPLVKNTPIWTTVLEHFKGPKVEIFNYSPKKRIRVKIGHRQNYTRLFVEQIGGSEFVKKEPVKVEKKAVEVEAEAEIEEKAPKAKAAKAEKPAKAEPKAETKKPAASRAKADTKADAKKPAEKPAAKKTTTASRGKTGSTKAEPKKAEPKKAAPKKPAAK